jgi:hypothetical protein
MSQPCRSPCGWGIQVRQSAAAVLAKPRTAINLLPPTAFAIGLPTKNHRSAVAGRRTPLRTAVSAATFDATHDVVYSGSSSALDPGPERVRSGDGVAYDGGRIVVEARRA